MTFYPIYSCTYSLLFINKNVSLGFIKLMCTRVSFAAELSTKLVYNKVFVKDYDYDIYLTKQKQSKFISQILFN